jgi:hypothetical protein
MAFVANYQLMKPTESRMNPLKHMVRKLDELGQQGILMGRLLSLTVLCYFVLYLLWPVVAYDTDLWYHLNAGRYILTEWKLPVSPFYSFITDPRPFVDYYWLFQVIVYGILHMSGYYGLIIMRALVAFGVYALILVILSRGRPTGRATIFVGFIFALFAIYLLPRLFFIRPHIYTFLFIAGFIYVLELKPRYVWTLPFLGLLWTNIHGVEYPVMLAILLAYGLQFLVDTMRSGERLGRPQFFHLFCLILSCATVLMTPHGLSLIMVPFKPFEYLSGYIAELRKLDVFTLSSPSPLRTITFQIILIALALTTAVLVSKKRLLIKHLVLLGAGLVLLTRGERFTFDFMLLSLPVFGAAMPHFLSFTDRSVSRVLYVVFISALVALQVWVMNTAISHRMKYPFSAKDLPAGVAEFLSKTKGSGKVLNNPDSGGYLQWALYPRYRIYMDLQLPFLFNEEDAFIAMHMFSNRTVFRKAIDKYDPSFVTLPVSLSAFKEIVKDYPQFVPVFVDDANVLYVNRYHYAHIAEAYELKTVDPYAFRLQRPVILNTRELNETVSEVSKMYAVYPESAIVNYVMAITLAAENNQAGARPYAKRIIEWYPDLAIGYRLMGNLLFDLAEYSGALAAYSVSIARSEPSEKPRIYKSMALTSLKLQRQQDTYTYLKKAVEVFGQNTTAEDLYDLGYSAYLIGKADEGRKLLRLAYILVPPQNGEFRKTVEQRYLLMGGKDPLY